MSPRHPHPAARVLAPLSVPGDITLPSLDTLPVAEHVAAYTDLHDRLQEALTSLDVL